MVEIGSAQAANRYIYIYIGLQNLKIQINMKLTNLLQQLLLGEKIQLKY